MRLTPTARVMVTATGSPSGTAATAIATATRNISRTPSPRRTPLLKARTEEAATAIPITLAKRSMRCCSGVGGASSRRINEAMEPNSVRAPVATTIPDAFPVVTTVPV
jgi:hypothetical protein